MNDDKPLDMEPIFTAYGSACYCAQNLEATLRFLLVLNKSSREGGEFVSIDTIESIESESAKTGFNEIFRMALAKEYLASAEISILLKANKTRNYLIHRYWAATNAYKLSNPEGRSWLIKDLNKIADSLRRADKITVGLVDRYLVEARSLTHWLDKLAAEIRWNPSFMIRLLRDSPSS